MEIMSTNVTNDTTYRGENCLKTTYFGGTFTKSLHNVLFEKGRKVAYISPKTEKA